MFWQDLQAFQRMICTPGKGEAHLAHPGPSRIDVISPRGHLRGMGLTKDMPD